MHATTQDESEVIRNHYTNGVADDYDKLKFNFRHNFEIPGIISLVKQHPNFETANMLDAGCGSGQFTNLLRGLTNGAVYGIDVSEEMLQKAVKDDASSSIVFNKVDLIGDSICSNLNVSEGFFDIAISVWVLCYAKNEKELRGIVRNIARALKSGGRFCCVLMDPGLTVEDCKNLRKHHFTYIPEDQTKEKFSVGDKLMYTLLDPVTGNKVVELPNYYFDETTLRRVFTEEGFRINMNNPLAKILSNNYLSDVKFEMVFDLTKL